MFIPACHNYFGISDNAFLPNCPKPDRHAATVWINGHDRDRITASTTETAESIEISVPAIVKIHSRIQGDAHLYHSPNIYKLCQ